MAAFAPNIMTLDQFRNASSQPRRRRGRMSWIDDTLKTWNGGNCPGRQVPNLIAVLDACHRWLQAKQGKNSALNTRRRDAINTLMGQVWARLQFEKFQAKKNGGANAHLRSLQGTYAHERTGYLATGKQTAYSATSAHQIIQLAQPLGIQNPPNFNHLTRPAFEKLVKDYAAELVMPSQVIFFNKQTRMTHMVVPWGGILHSANGQPFDTGGHQWPYAINEYGVLITAQSGAVENKAGDDYRFNHSTLNAGKDVITAGTLKAQGGRLTYIDNASGHYKPDRAALCEGLEALRDDDYDFATSACEVRIMESVLGNMRWSIYTDARTLLANRNAAPNSTA